MQLNNKPFQKLAGSRASVFAQIDAPALRALPLQSWEWAVFKTVKVHIDQHIEFLSCAKEIAQSHQEKWDGSGYPQGLSGDAIPISARLMALADVYDALICRRVYKPSFPHTKAVGIILDGRGSHFDPDVVDAFATIESEFRAIAERFIDSDQDILEKQKQLESAVGALERASG